MVAQLSDSDLAYERIVSLVRRASPYSLASTGDAEKAKAVAAEVGRFLSGRSGAGFRVLRKSLVVQDRDDPRSSDTSRSRAPDDRVCDPQRWLADLIFVLVVSSTTPSSTSCGTSIRQHSDRANVLRRELAQDRSTVGVLQLREVRSLRVPWD